MVALTIDGRKAQVKKDTSILNAAKSIGIEIPTLCYHEELEPYGACRLCTVEVIEEGRKSLITSCNHPVQDGIEVHTNTEAVIKIRKLIVELLLARCPEVKRIQELARSFGITIYNTRFSLKDKKCILCGLCVRACREIVGVNAISFTQRGTNREVETPFKIDSDVCIGCGLCTYVCPTGAIQMEFETVKKFKKIPGPERPCRFMLMGLIPYGRCSNSYQCWHCEVDQRMEDLFGTHPAFIARPAEKRNPVKIAEFLLFPELYCYPGHVWVKPLNGKVKIGLDDFACKLVGNIDDIKLPTLGKKLKREEIAWKLTCGTRYAEMRFPINGTIVDINPSITEDPSLIRKDPYNRGWIFIAESMQLEDDLKQLFHDKTAKDWLIRDSERLHQRVEKELGVVITNGRTLGQELRDNLDKQEWASLIKDFFLT